MLRFDAKALYRAMNDQRVARGMTWDAVAAEIGVSAATIRRTESGGRMEVDGMVAWLGEKVETFVSERAR